MNKRNKIIYWVATVWLSLGMTATAIVQLFKGEEGAGGVAMMNHLGFPVYLLTLLGIWKLLGVIAVLVPGFPLLKEWAYAGFFFLMSGALFSHLAHGDDFGAIYGGLLLLVLAGVSWYFRPADRKIISRNFRV